MICGHAADVHRFCFYQRIVEWVRLKERQPEAFEEAKKYEKRAEDETGNGTIYLVR
jgi:hypothetical protein